MTSALSITQAVNPPRAAFVDFPLGHTTGKAHDAALQRTIVSAALAAVSNQPRGSVTMIPVQWSDDDSWKDSVMTAQPSSSGSGAHRDSRVQRDAAPQYQCVADELAAQRTLAEGGCTTCVFL